MSRALAVLAAVALPVVAAAYVPGPDDLRQLWLRDRGKPADLYMRFSALPPDDDAFEIVQQTDGCWAKRVTVDGRSGEWTWRCGTREWEWRDNRWVGGQRKPAAWDDWAFETNIEALLATTPAEWLATRGLMRYGSTGRWLYGARHEHGTGVWFALDTMPLRLVVWQSRNERIGRVTMGFAEPGQLYPATIQFARAGRRDVVFERTAVQFGTVPAALELRRPAALANDLSRPQPWGPPVEPADDSDEHQQPAD